MAGRTITKSMRKRNSRSMGYKNKPEQKKNHPAKNSDTNNLGIASVRHPVPVPNPASTPHKTPMIPKFPSKTKDPRVRLVFVGSHDQGGDASIIPPEKNINSRNVVRSGPGSDHHPHRSNTRKCDNLLEVNSNSSINCSPDDSVYNTTADSSIFDPHENLDAGSTPGPTRSRTKSRPTPRALTPQRNSISETSNPCNFRMLHNVGDLYNTLMQAQHSPASAPTQNATNSQYQYHVQDEREDETNANAIAVQNPALQQTNDNNHIQSHKPGESQNDIGILTLVSSGLQILQSMKEQQNSAGQLIHKLFDEHANNFQRQHEQIMALHEGVQRQIENSHEATTNHVNAVHKSLWDKIEINEAKFQHLEASALNTEEVLKQQSQITTRQFNMLKAAQEAQFLQLKAMSKKLDQVLKNNNCPRRMPSVSSNSNPNTPLTATNGRRQSRRKNCPNCNHSFSSNYLPAHIKKYCKAEMNSTTLN